MPHYAVYQSSSLLIHMERRLLLDLSFAVQRYFLSLSNTDINYQKMAVICVESSCMRDESLNFKQRLNNSLLSKNLSTISEDRFSALPLIFLCILQKRKFLKKCE